MGLTLLVMVVCVASTAITLKVSSLYLVRSAAPAGLIGLMTTSSSAAYTTNDEIMRKNFCIEGNFANFAHSLSLGFLQPVECMILVLFLFYTASIQGVTISVIMLPVLLVTCTLLGVSSPPIPGGQIPIYALAASSMGLGIEAVAVFAAIDFVLDAVATGGKCFHIPIHSLKTAYKLGKCNVERLRGLAAKERM